jgi:PAS domain S-box-containing protein
LTDPHRPRIAERLRELVALNREIASTLDYDRVLRLVVEKTAEFTRADRCALLLVGADGLARVVDWRGLDAERVWAFAAPLDERIHTVLRALLGFREDDTFLGVPVITHGTIRGLLVVYRRGPEEPDPEEEYLVTALADQAALALEHARHYREVVDLSEGRARLLETIQANTSTYLAYLDRELRILEVNAAYCRAVGRSREELEGRAYAEVFPEPEVVALLQQVLESGEPVEPRRLERHTPSPEPVYWEWSARPVGEPHQGGVGLVLTAVDVSEEVRARRELEVASARKDELLSMLAHELRNPLAAITIAVDVMRRRLSDDPSLAPVRDAAARQIALMKRLLDDLLDVARITRGTIALEANTLDLTATIEEAVQASAPLVQAHGHELRVALPQERIALEGDADRLVQVVSNLLENAAKFTPPGGQIGLLARRAAGGVEIRVRDTGVGMAPGLLPHVFDPFTQAEQPLDRRPGGLGIGLTVVKRLVELHGGRVEAHSAGPNQGSELVVWLPAAPPAPAEASAEPDPSTQEELGRRVLVVEDNRDVAEMLGAVLELEGHAVHIVYDGLAAVEAALQHRPDVVLLDIGLPGIDGYEVARRLRQQLTPPPRLIALTGYGRESDRQKAEDAGFDAHLLKPADTEQLRRALESDAGAG